MGEITVQTKKTPKRLLINALILFLFLTLAVCVFCLTPVKGIFTPEVLGRFLEDAGCWAPLLFIFLHAASICLFVPASIMIILGAAVFGALLGFVYGWIGAVAGAGGAFIVGRTFGRGLVESLLSGRLKRYDDAIGRNGFATAFYMRLLNTPFTPVSFGISLTKIRFRDYIFGTGLGVVVGIFVMAFLGGALKDVWVSGDWNALLSYKFFLAAALYIISFFIPMTLKRFNIGMWLKSD